MAKYSLISRGKFSFIMFKLNWSFTMKWSTEFWNITLKNPTQTTIDLVIVVLADIGWGKISTIWIDHMAMAKLMKAFVLVDFEAEAFWEIFMLLNELERVWSFLCYKIKTSRLRKIDKVIVLALFLNQSIKWTLGHSKLCWNISFRKSNLRSHNQLQLDIKRKTFFWQF